MRPRVRECMAAHSRWIGAYSNLHTGRALAVSLINTVEA